MEAVAGGQEPHFDRDLIDELVHTITMHERAWQEWFAGQGLSPYELTYEDRVENPIGAAAAVLEHLGRVLPPYRSITVRDRRQADDLPTGSRVIAAESIQGCRELKCHRLPVQLVAPQAER